MQKSDGKDNSGAWCGPLARECLVALVFVLVCATVARAGESERHERLASACGEYIEVIAASAAVQDAQSEPGIDEATSLVLLQALLDMAGRISDAAQRVIDNLPEADYRRMVAIAKIHRVIRDAWKDPEWSDSPDKSPDSMWLRFESLGRDAWKLREAALVHFCNRPRLAEPATE